MSYNIPPLIVVILGPVLIYGTVAMVLRAPELVAGWPATVRHSIEVCGGLLVVAAWLTINSIGGGLAGLGLLLLSAPTVARFLSQTSETVSRQGTFHRPKNKRFTRFM